MLKVFKAPDSDLFEARVEDSEVLPTKLAETQADSGIADSVSSFSDTSTNVQRMSSGGLDGSPCSASTLTTSASNGEGPKGESGAAVACSRCAAQDKARDKLEDYEHEVRQPQFCAPPLLHYCHIMNHARYDGSDRRGTMNNGQVMSLLTTRGIPHTIEYVDHLDDPKFGRYIVTRPVCRGTLKELVDQGREEVRQLRMQPDGTKGGPAPSDVKAKGQILTGKMTTLLITKLAGQLLESVKELQKVWWISPSGSHSCDKVESDADTV